MNLIDHLTPKLFNLHDNSFRSLPVDLSLCSYNLLINFTNLLLIPPVGSSIIIGTNLATYTSTKPIATCKSTASLAETRALLAMKRSYSNGAAIIGSSSPAIIIMISHWLCNYITHQLILLLGIWSGQYFAIYFLLATINLVSYFMDILYGYNYFNTSTQTYYARSLAAHPPPKCGAARRVFYFVGKGCYDGSILISCELPFCCFIFFLSFT